MGILNGRNSANGGEFRLLGVGSPLLDVLVPVDEAFLETVPGEKGGMLMVEPEFQESVLRRLPSEPRRVPGGFHARTGVARGVRPGPVCFRPGPRTIPGGFAPAPLPCPAQPQASLC